MPIMARSDAQFCSARCRQRARRAGQVLPKLLTSRRRWVRRDKRKAPRTVNGGFASVTKPETWSTYTEAAASDVGEGVGFVLAEGDGIVCVDLDHCLEDGVLAPWARRILNMCPATYIEVSASGTGLHVFGRGEVSRGRRIRRDGESIEIYGRGRYIGVTGVRFEQASSELADVSFLVESLIQPRSLDAVEEKLLERVQADEERLADAQRRVPRREPGGPCAVCGGPVVSRQPRTVTCGAEDCKKAMQAARMRVYLAKRRLRDGLPYHSRYADQRRKYEKSRRGRQREAFVEHVDPEEIYERDGWMCRLCGGPVRPFVDPRHRLAPSLDHIVPLVLGGTHEHSNVQCAHYGCNSAKQARVAAMPLI